jgi:hypothetical protein
MDVTLNSMDGTDATRTRAGNLNLDRQTMRALRGDKPDHRQVMCLRDYRRLDFDGAGFGS